MNQEKVIRAVLLAQADEMGILDKVKAHEARLAARFIQQPTEEDLAAYGLALALVGARASELMTNAEPQVKAGEVEPAPIEVELQPTAEQIEAGRKALWEQIPGALDGLYEQMAEEGVDELLSDTVVFTWQAMIGARAK
ncbi:hypothetical protein IME_EC2_39 [Enterobacteria phage IME_EC2]|uniref:Uncharacterized protein n=1 Tax=Enterobacteria phage IME_EC2 TaxID=1414766 RepID=A0A0A0P256_9CAUD|nr:hypothetical protein HOQ93_gp39 [Enterobacteria phage IME_EC2]AGZ17830.1 hypothetical protein IME_EC2_39 [Enterobacteria phage IME_EC2]